MTTSEIAFGVLLVALVLVLVWRSLRRLRAIRSVVSKIWRTGRLHGLVTPLLLSTLAGAALVAAAGLPPDAVRLAGLSVLPRVLVGVGLTWCVASLLTSFVESGIAAFDVSAADNLRARQVHTQYRVLLRIGLILVWTIGAAVVLSTFPQVRALGTGLLASAGLAGLVLGLAAQRTLGNFLAGIQIALTQPVRLDDAVVIDGEWGWIEDITTTYVVVKIWDERRLIVPFSRLLEQSFENWTRTRADLLGSVMLWSDYRAPVAALREELHRVLAETDLWDGRVAVLQVVDTSERAIRLRALVSASTSPRAWDLRCFVREKLIAFLARECPEALPMLRAEVDTTTSATRGAGTPPRKSIDPSLLEPDAGGLPGSPASPGEPARSELEPSPEAD